MVYHTKAGKFEYPRQPRICEKCKKEKEIQVGCTLCDDCLLDITVKEIRENGSNLREIEI